MAREIETKCIHLEEKEDSIHLIKVEDKKDAQASVYEDVADTIKNIILQQKRNDVYGNKVAELKEKYVTK